MLFQRNVAPPRIVNRVVIGLVGFFFAISLVGDLLLASFVDTRPLALIALSSRNRNLLLVTEQLSALSYFTVGFIRLVIADPLFFLLGYWYGDKAKSWIERRSRTYGPLVRDGESIFRKGALFLIFVAPNQYVCAMAGAVGIRLRTFFALNIAGTIARLVIIWYLGKAIDSLVRGTVDTIGRYRVWVFGVMLLGVLWTIFGEFRGNNSEVKSLVDLTNEGDEAEPSDDAAESASSTESD